MTEQHSTDDHTFDESLRAPSRWGMRSENTRITRGLSGGVGLTRTLAAILILLTAWFCQQYGPVDGSSLPSVMHGLPHRQHHGLTTCATDDAVGHHLTTMASLSVSLPPPPGPPAPVPVVPRPVPVVPVVPHPVPVVPRPVPVVPVVPHPVPVVPVVPRPVPVVPVVPRPVPVVPVVPHPVPVVPRPVPVVPHPVPVVPHPVPVSPSPVPAPPTPTWVFPRPVPVVPAPTRAFPPPVVALKQVPNLVGIDLVTAQQLLIQNGLAIGSISKQESNLRAGTIVRTFPSANTAVPAGTAINLVVAV